VGAPVPSESMPANVCARCAAPRACRKAMKGSVSIPHLVLNAEADPETKLARATDFWLNLERRRAFR
jgi:hypothetical protein